tara:strand:+ start:16078 stop:17727 length:1650 start_codon:yes stop_codon:yes gene_type:complete
MSQESNGALMAQLKKHYNLSLDLFAPETAFFFEGAQRQHNLETLRHLSSFGDMVLFLTGDKGAGKTVLLKALKNASFEGLNVIYLDSEQIVNNAQGNASAVFLECARALGVDFKNGVTPSELLSVLLVECHRLVASEGVRTLFIFDDADKLSKKNLQTLFGFCRELPPESALVMLFSGSSSLLQWSKSGSNLEQTTWCHQVQLKPLSQPDVHAYLEQALAAAQYDGELELSESQLQQLSDLGKGLPGRINKLFPSIVLEPGLLKLSPRKKRSAFPVHVLFGIAGLLIASLVFVSYQHGIFDRIIPVLSLENNNKEVVKKEVIAPVSDASGSRKVGLMEKQRQQETRLAMLDRALKEKGISLSEEKGAFGDRFAAGEDDSALELDLQASTEGVQVSGAIEVSSSLMQEGTEVALEKNASEGAESSSEGSGVGHQALTNKELVVEKKAMPENFKPKSWLSGQPSSSYMAQILGSYQERTAQEFIKKVSKQKFEVYYLKTEHKGKPWYVVFYGVFPAKTHAQDAVKNAPKVIRSQNPWIRKASDVLSSYPRK